MIHADYCVNKSEILPRNDCMKNCHLTSTAKRDLAALASKISNTSLYVPSEATLLNRKKYFTI